MTKRKQLGDFIIGKTIGQGAFSKVKLGVHKETGLKVAIKIIDKKLMAEKAEKAKRKQKKPVVEELVVVNDILPSYLSKLQLEVQLLMRLDHPHVIKLYQMLEDDDECFIIMEYASGGELINYIAGKTRLTEKEARFFFRQMVSAIDHCHMANVVHRDLKLENLLLSNSRTLLITDFGLGRVFSEDQLLKTFCGTPNYAAVELVSGIPYKAEKSDIWSMGVILYIMMTGYPPFKGDNISQLYGKIKSVTYECPDYFSPQLINLLSCILVKDPSRRSDMDVIRMHEWVNIDENEPPPRIRPRLTNNDDPTAMAKAIQSITAVDSMIVYNFNSIANPSKDKAVQNHDKLIAAGLARRKSSFTSNSSPMDPTTLQLIPAEVNLGPIARRLSKSGSGREPSFFLPPTIQESNDRPATTRRASAVFRSPARANKGRQESDPTSKEPKARPRSYSATYSPGSFLPEQTRIISPTPKRNSIETEDPNMIFAQIKDGDDDDNELGVVTEEEIIGWHHIHRPAKEIRTIRWSFNSSTTSTLPPSTIFQHIHKALDELNEINQNPQIISSNRGSITYSRNSEYYVFECDYLDEQGESIKFEIEVCKVWLMKLYGVKIKRTFGDPLTFKSLYVQFVQRLSI